MNAERLHSIVGKISNELTTKRIEPHFQAMVQALATVVSNPHPQHQQGWASNLSALRGALANSPSDNSSPSARQVLDEIGASGFIGKGLLNRVNEIVQRDQITLSLALEELQEVHHNLKLLVEAINQADASLNTFNIGTEELEPGEAEIGILIPRAGVGNELRNFAGELKEWTLILNTFSEVATGKPDSLEIKTISSSDLLIFLKGGLHYSACVAKAVAGVVNLYKTLLEVKKLHKGLTEQSVPAESLKGVEAHANDVMEKGIEKLSVEIVSEFYKAKDNPRRHELITMTKVSLNKMANRIDRGFNVEVRVEAIADNEGEEVDGEQKPGEVAAIQDIAAIQGASSEMKYIKSDGAPILNLPEGGDKLKK